MTIVPDIFPVHGLPEHAARLLHLLGPHLQEIRASKDPASASDLRQRRQHDPQVQQQPLDDRRRRLGRRPSRPSRAAE